LIVSSDVTSRSTNRIRFGKSTVLMPHFGDYQTEIYFKGLRGVLPSLPADFKLLEQRAQAAMPPSVLSYVQGGCGDEFTQSQNANAFHHWGHVGGLLDARPHR
jgi:lactate 2-monooxygenase